MALPQSPNAATGHQPDQWCQHPARCETCRRSMTLMWASHGIPWADMCQPCIWEIQDARAVSNPNTYRAAAGYGALPCDAWVSDQADAARRSLEALSARLKAIRQRAEASRKLQAQADSIARSLGAMWAARKPQPATHRLTAAAWELDLLADGANWASVRQTGRPFAPGDHLFIKNMDHQTRATADVAHVTKSNQVRGLREEYVLLTLTNIKPIKPVEK